MAKTGKEMVFAEHDKVKLFEKLLSSFESNVRYNPQVTSTMYNLQLTSHQVKQFEKILEIIKEKARSTL